MSVTGRALAPALGGRGLVLQRIGLALAAVLLVAGAMSAVAWWLAPPPPPPSRGPFGMGMREAAPSGSGLAAYILAVQASFFRQLQAGVAALKDSGDAFWPLMMIGFAYGVFHAAGPGHGKGVIAAYVVADERALVKGLLLSLAAALVQALVAIAIVGIVAALLRATAATMREVTNAVEIASFAAVAVLGLALAWRKAGKLLGILAFARDPGAAAATASCDHVHLPPPERFAHLRRWREMAGVAIAAGIRPCAGALVVLVFALSQGLFAAGVAATFAMALGTALTTGAIAALAVLAKATALKLAGGRGIASEAAAAGLELLAAAFVLILGVSLLLGLWSAGPSS